MPGAAVFCECVLSVLSIDELFKSVTITASEIVVNGGQEITRRRLNAGSVLAADELEM